jgi:hypothetical protein
MPPAGIWPRPRRVVALNPAIVRARKMGKVRQKRFTSQVIATAILTYYQMRPH